MKIAFTELSVLLLFGVVTLSLAGGSDEGGGHVHFKINVPKFIDKIHHTKTVYIHTSGGHGGGGHGHGHGHKGKEEKPHKPPKAVTGFIIKHGGHEGAGAHGKAPPHPKHHSPEFTSHAEGVTHHHSYHTSSYHPSTPSQKPSSSPSGDDAEYFDHQGTYHDVDSGKPASRPVSMVYDTAHVTDQPVDVPLVDVVTHTNYASVVADHPMTPSYETPRGVLQSNNYIGPIPGRGTKFGDEENYYVIEQSADNGQLGYEGYVDTGRGPSHASLTTKFVPSGEFNEYRNSGTGPSSEYRTSVTGLSNDFRTSFTGPSNQYGTSVSGGSNEYRSPLPMTGRANEYQTSITRPSSEYRTSVSGGSNEYRTPVEGRFVALSGNANGHLMDSPEQKNGPPSHRPNAAGSVYYRERPNYNFNGGQPNGGESHVTPFGGGIPFKPSSYNKIYEINEGIRGNGQGQGSSHGTSQYGGPKYHTFPEQQQRNNFHNLVQSNLYSGGPTSFEHGFGEFQHRKGKLGVTRTHGLVSNQEHSPLRGRSEIFG